MSWVTAMSDVVGNEIGGGREASSMPNRTYRVSCDAESRRLFA